MRNLLSRYVIGALALGLAQGAAAGGLVEIEGAVFAADSNELTNPWFLPVPPGTRLVYFAEGTDECIVDVVDVLETADQSRTHVNGVAVREVLDEEWLDEDCNRVPDPGMKLESTRDWYAEDTLGNDWYYGEDTVAYDFDECDHPVGLDGCGDGSWAAGEDVAGVGSIAEEGIVMLADPTEEKGVFYFQEYYEDEATDMAKVLNLVTVDTFLFGEVEGCAKLKEWAPLDPGNVEHKFSCENLGLVRVDENAGGKTLVVDLISVAPIP